MTNVTIAIIVLLVIREARHAYKRYMLNRDLQKTVYALGYTYDELMQANQDNDRLFSDVEFMAELLQDYSGIRYTGKVA